MTFHIPHKITPTDQSAEAARAAEAHGTTEATNNRSLVPQSVEEIQHGGGKLAFKEMRCGDSYQESHESKMINADLGFAGQMLESKERTAKRRHT